jgi:hypothetical protein
MIGKKKNIEWGPKSHQDLRRFFDGWVAIWHKSGERFFLSRFALSNAQE